MLPSLFIQILFPCHPFSTPPINLLIYLQLKTNVCSLWRIGSNELDRAIKRNVLSDFIFLQFSFLTPELIYRNSFSEWVLNFLHESKGSNFYLRVIIWTRKYVACSIVFDGKWILMVNILKNKFFRCLRGFWQRLYSYWISKCRGITRTPTSI